MEIEIELYNHNEVIESITATLLNGVVTPHNELNEYHEEIMTRINGNELQGSLYNGINQSFYRCIIISIA